MTRTASLALALVLSGQTALAGQAASPPRLSGLEKALEVFSDDNRIKRPRPLVGKGRLIISTHGRRAPG